MNLFHISAFYTDVDGGMMDQLSDAELMEFVKAGDYTAFDELYNRYAPGLRMFLFSLTWDQDTAEDYLQETFLRLFRARNRYQPTGKFKTFIFRIAKNYYITKLRQDHNKNGFEQQTYTFDSDPFENIHANARIEPEVHLMEDYRLFRLRQAISTLPEGQKLVFVLSHFEDMNYTEIAELLKIPTGTVKSRMHSAVNTLRSLLKEESK